jgi:hypothetical protein
MGAAPEQQEQPVPDIIGEKVAVGSLRHDRLPLDMAGLNDCRVRRLSGIHAGPVRSKAVSEETCGE